jgi:EmrB/QacA subfamily drug resistance transporter
MEPAVIREAGAPASGPDRRAKRLILAGTMVGSSMAFIDGSVVNVATPAIQAALGFGAGGIQWVINGYLLFLGALVLTGGAAADRFGRRRVFLTGIVGFTLASLGCGLAPTPEVLVIARCVQGCAAALLTPASLALLGSSFDESERGRAIGAWAGMGALMSALGPVFGGWLVDALSWRTIFLINLPLAGLAIALTRAAAIPETRVANPRPLDYPGAALIAIGLGLTIWGLTKAADIGLFAPRILIVLAAGFVALGLFVIVQARSPNAMAPLSLFRARTFSGANLLTLWLYFAVTGALFFLPFELIRVHFYSARAAGASLLPMSVVGGLLSSLAGRLSDRVGVRLPLTLGPLIAAAGYAMLAATGERSGYWTGIFPATLVLAFGMTMSVAPLTAAVMGAVGKDQTGAASGVNIAIARVAGSFAIAVTSLIFLGRFDAAMAGADLGGARPPPLGAGLAIDPAAAPALLAAAERSALHAGFVAVMLTAAAAALLGAATSAILIRDAPPAGTNRRP